MIEEYTAAQKVLTDAYNHFNTRFAESKLKDALITVQSVGRKRAYGWFAQNAWRDKDNKSFHEINIGAEHFKRSNEDIFETLLHEMAHLWNHQNGIDDCTPTQYHKKTFAEAAKRFGLSCEKMGRFGYAKTGLTPISSEAIKALNLADDVFGIFRSFGNDKEKKPSKYIMVPVSQSYGPRIDELIGLTGVKNKRALFESLLDKFEK